MKDRLGTAAIAALAAGALLGRAEWARAQDLNHVLEPNPYDSPSAPGGACVPNAFLSVEGLADLGTGGFVRIRARGSRIYAQRITPSEMVVIDHARGQRRVRRFRMHPAADFSVDDAGRVVTISGRVLRVLSGQGSEIGRITLDVGGSAVSLVGTTAIVRTAGGTRVVDLSTPGRPVILEDDSVSPDQPPGGLPSWLDPQPGNWRVLQETPERWWILRTVRNAQYVYLFNEQGERLGMLAVAGTITGAMLIDDTLYVARRDVESDSPLIAVRLACGERRADPAR